jgi:heme/copper-type cytochrome/quinol oxidase subunit 4
VRSHIRKNRIAGENEGVFTASVEEDIERCMLVLLFHIALFCISFMVCICVHLVYYMYMLRALVHGKLSSLHAFLYSNLLHVCCVFAALLHLNKKNSWR